MSSLAEIIDASDLVVRGSITGVQSRWRGGDAYDSEVKVSIVEVLKGEPTSRDPDMIDVGIGYLGLDIEALDLDLPAHDHLWFLIADEERAGRYYPTDYVQLSVLRDIGGVVEVIKPDWIALAYSREHYPVPLDGTSFEALVERVGERAEVPLPLARVAPPGSDEPAALHAC